MSSLRKRSAYQIIKNQIDEIAKTNDLYKNVRVSESSLRLEVLIDPTTKTYNFPVLVNDNNGVSQPEEIRLAIQDLFVITEFAIFLGCKDDFINPKSGKILMTSSQWQNFPPGLALDELYNGKLSLSINNDVYLYKYDLKRFHRFTKTQFTEFGDPSTLPAAPPFYAVNNLATQQDIDYKYDGMEIVDPLITLSGAKKNSISIDIPKALPLAPGGFPMDLFISAQDGTTRGLDYKTIVFLCRGVLCQNLSTFQM